MSAQRTERLLNLVIALLATRRWMTKEQIRAAVPQYAASAGNEAFDRMFERDKDELRDLGVPIETGRQDPLFEDEPGYRIDPESYVLAPIAFTQQELTVLGLAARVWQQASLSGPAARGLVKLKALGLSVDDSSLIGIEPRVTTTEPSFAALYAATRDRVPVRFGYRKQGEETAQRRTVEPWKILSWHGRWYLHGFDRDRRSERVFRLSRISGAVRRVAEHDPVVVPAGIDSHAAVRRVWGAGPPRTAIVDLEPDTGWMLRHRVGADGAATRLELEFSDVDQFAGELAALGPRVLVREPADLREAVIGLLEAALTAHSAAAGAR